LNRNNFEGNYFELIFIYSFIYINTPFVEMQPGEMQFGEMQLSPLQLLYISNTFLSGYKMKYSNIN